METRELRVTSERSKIFTLEAQAFADRYGGGVFQEAIWPVLRFRESPEITIDLATGPDPIPAASVREVAFILEKADRVLQNAGLHRGEVTHGAMALVCSGHLARWWVRPLWRRVGRHTWNIHVEGMPTLYAMLTALMELALAGNERQPADLHRGALDLFPRIDRAMLPIDCASIQHIGLRRWLADLPDGRDVGPWEEALLGTLKPDEHDWYYARAMLVLMHDPSAVPELPQVSDLQAKLLDPPRWPPVGGQHG